MIVSDEMQQQAKALADPSRFRLFQHIADAPEAVGVSELTELLGFNHNAIRQHLAILVEAGLVAEGTEQRTVRGRPRKEYTDRADALNAFGAVSGSYETLAGLLLAVTTNDDTPYEIGLRAGRDSSALGGEPDDAFRELIRALARDGFEPEQTDETSLSLMNCPFANVASQSPGVVCELHRGLIDGHMSAHDLVGELTPKDPHKAGCRVVLKPKA